MIQIQAFTFQINNRLKRLKKMLLKLTELKTRIKLIAKILQYHMVKL